MLPLLFGRGCWHHHVRACRHRGGAFREDGAHTMAAWLSFRLGISHATASERVRLARALEDLPRSPPGTRRGGSPSTSCTPWWRSPPRRPTPSSPTAALSAAQLAALARQARRVSDEEAAEAYRRRHLRWSWNHDQSWLRLSGGLPADQAAVVANAIERLVGQAPTEAPIDDSPFHARCADALVGLASASPVPRCRRRPRHGGGPRRRRGAFEKRRCRRSKEQGRSTPRRCAGWSATGGSSWQWTGGTGPRSG